MSTFTSTIDPTSAFCFGSYKNRHIATYQHGQSWLVYLDEVMLPNLRFASSSDGLRWLRGRIDGTAQPKVQRSGVRAKQQRDPARGPALESECRA